MPSPHALIIGAGIGGLATAIALRRIGMTVRVFEQAKALDAIGAGLSLWPNAVHALEMLGLGPALQAFSVPIAAGTIYRWDGQTLVHQHNTDASLMPIGIHRADLQTLLLDALGRDYVQLDAACTRVEQHDSHISAYFADGSSAQGDMLIAADGIHSTIRAQIHGQQPPEYAGYTAWRGVTHFDHCQLKPGESWGAGMRFGCIPLVGERVYWFATANAAAGQRAANGEKSMLLRYFGHWHTPIPDLITATPAQAILRGDIADRKPLKYWGLGRVTLLGDAAHPMTPNLGQGACQALEDALVLAQTLQHNPDIETALRTYEARRIPRTSAIVGLSRQLGWVGQWQQPLAVRARDLLFRMMPARIQEAQLRRIIA